MSTSQDPDKLMEAIRIVNAKVDDYMNQPFPEGKDALMLEIVDLGEEILALLTPIVEAEDDPQTA